MACRDRSAQRHKTRPSRIKPLGDDVAACIVALTLDDPPGETTHWTGALMATASGVSVQFGSAHLARPRTSAASRSAVQLSTDPKFVDKLVFLQ